MICFEICVVVSLVFANPGKWVNVVVSAVSILDGKVPISVWNLSRHDKIVQMAMQKPPTLRSGQA
jgi:hypothetical protein